MKNREKTRFTVLKKSKRKPRLQYQRRGYNCFSQVKSLSIQRTLMEHREVHDRKTIEHDDGGQQSKCHEDLPDRGKIESLYSGALRKEGHIEPIEDHAKEDQ